MTKMWLYLNDYMYVNSKNKIFLPQLGVDHLLKGCYKFDFYARNEPEIMNL